MARGKHPQGPEAIVIGSGFGGAVAACRLAEDGYRVLVLERGRRYDAGDFPALPTDSALLPDLKRWNWSLDHGLWDVVDLKELVSVQAAGYGGGSLVYANVHLRPPREVFDDRWPAPYRGRTALEPFFDLAATMLEVKPATRHPRFATFTKSHTLRTVAGELGRDSQFFHPPLAVTFADGPNTHGVEQGACTACGRCSTGCPARAKNTLDHNYLALAERHGASVVTECEVTEIVELDGGRFRVHGVDHLEGATVEYEAPYLFVCAGSVHTTRLLARTKFKDPQAPVKACIGAGYFPGGDALGMVYDTARPQEPAVGPTITTAIAHGESAERFFLLQDGGYPNELARLLGLVRAPAWLGRNRLSKAGSVADGLPPPTPPDFRLSSPLDEVLRAAADGLGAKMASPQLLAAFPALLKELERPLLLSAVVDRTIDASIRARYARLRLTRGWDPDKLPLSKLIAWERKLIRAWIGTNEALGERALGAVFTQGGLKVADVAREMLGYDARGATSRLMLLAMGRDAAPGLLLYDAENDTQIADLDLFHLAGGYANEERLMADVARALAGELRTNPAWAFLGKPITVHNQGGCRMSARPEHGVTDPNGAVHGYPTLFVFDGAALCTSVGVNPSATITAIAERNVAHFLKTHAPERPNAAGRAEYAAHVERAKRFRAGPGQQMTLEPPHLADPVVPFGTEPLGLRFDESMAGYFSPGADEPAHDGNFRERERRGRPAHPWRVDLRLSAQNLASFFEDETHALRATGSITLVMPGETRPRELELDDGRVELMVPRYKPHVPVAPHATLVAQEFALRGQARFEALTDTELALLGTPQFRGRHHKTIHGSPPPDAARFLKYWLTFRSQGVPYLLYGYKRVKDDPGFDAWRDTASLFSRLYRVTGKPDLEEEPRGELVGSGVLHVDMNEFMFAQLPSMVVAEGVDAVRPRPGMPSRDRPEAVDPARAAWAVGKFAVFFFGSLQRVYAPGLGPAIGTFFGLSEGSRPQ